MTYTYGDRAAFFRPAPKPANFEALAAAWNDPDRFAAEHGIYVDQARRAGAHPGHLLGVIDADGNVS